MSACKAKAEFYKEHMIQAEVEKKLAQLEVDQRVLQADPLLQEKMQKWIKEEVEKVMVSMMQQIKHTIQLESQLYYARSVADLPINRVRSPTPVNVDELPESPPLLQRQDGYMINNIDEEEDEDIQWDIPEL